MGTVRVMWRIARCGCWQRPARRLMGASGLGPRDGWRPCGRDSDPRLCNRLQHMFAMYGQGSWTRCKAAGGITSRTSPPIRACDLRELGPHRKKGQRIMGACACACLKGLLTYRKVHYIYIRTGDDGRITSAHRGTGSNDSTPDIGESGFCATIKKQRHGAKPFSKHLFHKRLPVILTPMGPFQSLSS